MRSLRHRLIHRSWQDRLPRPRRVVLNHGALGMNPPTRIDSLLADGTERPGRDRDMVVLLVHEIHPRSRSGASMARETCSHTPAVHAIAPTHLRIASTLEVMRWAKTRGAPRDDRRGDRGIPRGARSRSWPRNRRRARRPWRRPSRRLSRRWLNSARRHFDRDHRRIRRHRGAARGAWPR